MQWRLIEDGPLRGPENMERDLAIATDVAAGRCAPTLRLYAWSPPAVSIGRHQTEETACDAAACRAAGWDVVRRPTGGRAVLHAADEVTYSVAMPLAQAPAGVLAAYAWLAQALVGAYRRLGLPAELAAGKHLAVRSGACFDAPAAHEIVVGGRKLAGSAQVRRAGYLLQHGSLPVTFDPALHARLLGLPPEAEGLLARQGAGIRDFLDPPPDRAEIVRAVAAGFVQALGIVFENAAALGRVVPGRSGGSAALSAGRAQGG